MAQYLTLLPILLLFAVFSPIVCPNGQMYNGRRDRAPYIESSENRPQYLDDSHGQGGSRNRKTPYHKDNNAMTMDYTSNEQLSSQPQDLYKRINPSNTEQTTTDPEVEKNIRSIFSTDFGPGLYLFKNTLHSINQPHANSYYNNNDDNDQMIADQPVQSHEHSSSAPFNDKEFFKVQRSPNGKLSLVYNRDFVRKEVKDNTNVTDSTSNSSSSESFENRFQTHFPAGLQVNTSSTQSANINHTRNKDITVHFPTEVPEKEEINYTVDTNDCVEKDGEKNGKPFCTNLRNYPEKKHLEQIIKQRFSNLESFFGEDLVLPQNISQRMNNEPNEEFLCKSRTRVIYPQAGLNKDYNWLIIVNIPNYKQGIRIEECINEGSPCGESNGLSLPNHYTATCKQSYIYRSLVAYTNDTVIKDQFKMPSCCKCVLRTG